MPLTAPIDGVPLVAGPPVGARSGRYAGIEVARITLPDGRVVAYHRRRFLPQPEALATQGWEQVNDGDRVDHLAAPRARRPHRVLAAVRRQPRRRPGRAGTSPAARCGSRSPRGSPVPRGIQVQLLIGTVSTSPAPPDVIDALREVQVTQNAGQRSGFQLRFALAKGSSARSDAGRARARPAGRA